MVLSFRLYPLPQIGKCNNSRVHVSLTSLLIAAVSVPKTIKQRDSPWQPIFPSDVGMQLQQIEITTAQFHGGPAVVGAAHHISSVE